MRGDNVSAAKRVQKMWIAVEKTQVRFARRNRLFRNNRHAAELRSNTYRQQIVPSARVKQREPKSRLGQKILREQMEG
jgi:hypothetical protein